jgi:quinohemoprotein amine dehydrogenase beta subunit
MKKFAALAAALALWGAFLPSGATAKEYILTGIKPNTLVLVDPAARKVARSYPLPGGGSPLGIVTSPDGKVAYTATNHWGSLIGIDLDSGRQVFGANFTQSENDFTADGPAPQIRVRSVFGLEISPDGKELFVTEAPVRLRSDEYEVMDTRIAVYRSDAGLDAKPVRFLPVPRRTTNIMLSADGTKLYANSWDLYTLDAKDGKVLKVDKILNWDRPGFAPPDLFNVWNQFEQAKVFVSPYYANRTDLDPSNPAASRVGMLSLDLKTGAVRLAEFENFSTVMFSSVVNPVRRNEVFSVFKTLTKSDLDKNQVIKRINLPHAYYCINISGDGREVYLAGAGGDIAVYSTDTLKLLGHIEMPGGADMGGSWVRMVERP